MSGLQDHFKMASIKNHMFPLVLALTMAMITLVTGQPPTPVLVEEGIEGRLSFSIPNTNEVNDETILYIKLDSQDGKPPRSILFLFTSTFTMKITDDYKDRLTATASLSTRRLTMNLNSVGQQDAGFVGCYSAATATESINNCGQLLILLRQPDPPSISVGPPSSLLVEETLQLDCNAKSRSLPPGHGLATNVWWMDSTGNSVSSGSRLYVNSDNQLQIDRLERTDAGLKFTCMAADDTGNQESTKLRSDPSPVYTVSPEYAPMSSDLTVIPHFNNGARVYRKIGEELNFTCQADCNPPCTVKWMFKADNDDARYGEVVLADRLKLIKNDVTRLDQGSYRCRASNEHSENSSPVRTTFKLDIVYLESPQVYMDGEASSNASIWETEDMKLRCVFDANPVPSVIWRSPSGLELLSQTADGPEDQPELSGNGVWKRLYTSDLQLQSLACEDSGIYSCHGTNTAHEVEGRMNVRVKCSPEPVKDIPGKSLEEEYVWEIPQSLTFEFVMKGWPAPQVTRVVSSLNDNRLEVLGEDLIVNTMASYTGKPWLTLFHITSRRPLTREDAGRMYTMTFSTQDDVRDFQFRIRPRGPPHKVMNVTTENVRHDSVEVFWRPGFDGGEPQTFSVVYRKEGTDGQDPSDWKTAVEGVPVDKNSVWVEVEITGLQASTWYTMSVVAYNTLGNTSASFRVETTGAPSGGLSAGAVVGIVFAVLIVLLVIAVLLYWFVYRPRYGKKVLGKEIRISVIREKVNNMLNRKEKKASQNGGVAAGDNKPKKNPIVKMKSLLNKLPAKLKKDYDAVPVRDVRDMDDDSDDFKEFDDDVINTNEIKPAGKDETVYANASVIRKTAEEKRKNLGRQKNEDGLVYVSVDFPDRNTTKEGKNNNNMKDKGNTNNPEETTELKEDNVPYSELDFSKMPLKNGTHQEVTAEVNPTLKEEEISAAQDHDGDDDVDAADGGADVDYSDAGVALKKMPEELHFGTAV